MKIQSSKKRVICEKVLFVNLVTCEHKTCEVCTMYSSYLEKFDELLHSDAVTAVLIGPIWPYTTFERAVKIPSALVTLQSMGFLEVLIQEIPSAV